MKTLTLSPAPILLLAFAFLSPSALAQKMAPGLWEQSMTMKTQSGQMEAGMAKMKEEMARVPPEQRKMVEEMMKQRGMGAAAAGGGGNATTVKVCITPEQAARDEMPQQQRGDCKQLSKERSGNTVKVKFACTGEHASTGEGEYTLISDKAHKGHTVVDTKIQGKAERIEMDHSARWLGADCGEVKPRAMPAPRAPAG